MSQERIHGGGKQGRASVTCSSDSGGMHSLIGVIDTALPFGYFSARPKARFFFLSQTHHVWNGQLILKL